MAERELTNYRPTGFSIYQRQLYGPGRELRDKTRHIDRDWTWLCDGCRYVVAIIEEKFRGTSPPPRVAGTECDFTRVFAEQAGTAALAVAWTNAERDSSSVPDEFSVRLWIDGQERALVDHDVERILIKLFRVHWDDCPRRPF